MQFAADRASRHSNRVTVAHALVLTLLTLPCAASAQAGSPTSELPIEWRAPESCPDEQALIRRLDALLGEEPRDLGKLSSVRGVVRETPGGKQLTLDVEESGQHSTRQFEARDCVDLIDAAALAIALALHGESAPPPAAEPAPISEAPARELDAQPPAPAPRPLGWSLAAEAAVDSGALPELALGVAARARVLFGAWSVDGHGLFLPSQSVALGNAEAVAFSLLVGGVRSCRQLLERAVHVAACGSLEAGQFRATGDHLQPSRTLKDLWLAAGGGGEAQARIGGGVWLQIRLEPVVPFGRKRYAVDDTQVVHAAAALDWRFYVGLSLNGQ